ncbi:SapC family protein [Kordiimonas aestuarii]|uniref:SapC family protein n=1 Tax=Kordiimonas aestuarii TaxID=1005925 RepID=UPI0021CE536C|nr:SapC family protein [Kordiimonas aestuarii]
MARIVPLHPDQHSKLKVKDGAEFNLVEAEHIIPLVVHEFVAAATDMPIVFVKNSDTGQFQAVAMLGVKPGENVYVNDGKWLGMYVPAILSQAPFRLMPNSHNQDQLMLAINEESELASSGEGELLFGDDGEPTEYLKKRQKGVETFFEHNQVTQGFVALLAEMELLVERTLNIDVDGEKINLSGVYFVDEEKLGSLSDEKFMDIKKRGFLPVIYAHLISLNQIRRLGQLKADRARD